MPAHVKTIDDPARELEILQLQRRFAPRPPRPARGARPVPVESPFWWWESFVDCAWSLNVDPANVSRAITQTWRRVAGHSVRVSEYRTLEEWESAHDAHVRAWRARPTSAA